MGWVDKLRGKVVALDTAPLIYYIEQREPYINIVRPLFQAVDRGDCRIVTSTITLLEVLVQPLRKGDESLAQSYNDILLSSPNIELAPLTPLTAQIAAELRSASKLKTPDAVQLATALSHNASIFITNDRDFGEVAGIEILRLMNLAI